PAEVLRRSLEPTEAQGPGGDERDLQATTDDKPGRSELGHDNGAPEAQGDRRARVVAIANQKGGVGKSTTAVNLGACLADSGQRVLVVDLDPQGNASTGLGIDQASRKQSTYQVMTATAEMKDAMVSTGIDGLWALPSNID